MILEKNRYTIYLGLPDTEERRRLDLLTIVAEFVGGATVTYGDGIWRNEAEPCARIEIVGQPAELVLRLARNLKLAFRQDNVLLVEEALPVWPDLL